MLGHGSGGMAAEEDVAGIGSTANSRIGTPTNFVDGIGNGGLVIVKSESAVAVLTRGNVAPAASACSDCCYASSPETSLTAAGSSGAASCSAAANSATAYSATG
jgi:hypothetical protein